MNQGLHRIIPLIKNLRGIVYFKKWNEVVEEKLNWLKKKFRYRNIGFFKEFTPEVKESGRFVSLVLRPELDKFFKEDISKIVACCSYYLCALLLLDEASRKGAEKLALSGIAVNLKALTDREYKFNLRLLDYVVVDFGTKQDLNISFEELKEIAENDMEKRFWRLKREGKVKVIFYLSLMKGIGKNKWEKLPYFYKRIVPAMFIQI
jgi:hypothetical protein